MCTPNCLPASQSPRLLGSTLLETFNGLKCKNVCSQLPSSLSELLGSTLFGTCQGSRTPKCLLPAAFSESQNAWKDAFWDVQGPNTKMCTPSCLPASQSPRLLCSTLLGTFKGPNHQNVYSQLPSRLSKPPIVHSEVVGNKLNPCHCEQKLVVERKSMSWYQHPNERRQTQKVKRSKRKEERPRQRDERSHMKGSMRSKGKKNSKRVQKK